MKKIKSILLSFFSIALISIFIFTSCKDDEKAECCNGFGIVEKTYDTAIVFNNVTIPVNGSIKIYTAMTPLNKPFCDSLVWDTVIRTYLPPYKANDIYKQGINMDLLCSPEEALEKYLDGCRSCCPCRKNNDSIYDNYNNLGYFNDYFIIDSIEEYFPSNKLFLRVPGDTTKIKEFIDYDNTASVFEGQITKDSTLYGRNPINKMLQSGKYEYELILFTDSTKVVSIDTIIGHFCIIRTIDYENEGCEAKNANDPLINP